MIASDQIIRRIVAHHSLGGTVLLLSDYDGTLADVAPRPQDAILSETTRDILCQLSRQPRTRLGIISGRAVDELRCMVQIDRALYVGTSGLELDFDGKITRPPHCRAIARLSDAFARLEHLLAEEPAAWLERKPLGITLQLADLLPSRRAVIRKVLVSDFSHRLPEMRLIECDRGVEIVPDVGLNKATAIQRIIEHINAKSPLVVFAGNDGNDADALVATEEIDGIAIAVGPNAPPARYRLGRPVDFVGLLRHTLVALNSRNAIRPNCAGHDWPHLSQA